MNGANGTDRIGRHLIADLHGVAPDRLRDADALAEAMTRAARAGGMTPLGAPMVHRFPNGGVTAILLLAESHIALHTYPEHGYLALDVFACGGGDPEAAVRSVRRWLEPTYERVTSVERGRGAKP